MTYNQNMATLTIIIITGNKAHEILPTLKIAKKFANEIILVDTGSTDKTIKISKPYYDKLIKTTGFNFAQWRNVATKHATSDWLLYLDTDERVPKALAGEILATLTEPIHDAYTIPRREILLGKHLKHWPDTQVLRLIKKSSLKQWKGNLHEQPEIAGTVGELKNEMVHLTHRSFDENISKTIAWSKLEAEMLFKSNHPKMKGWRFWRILLTEFYQRFFKQGLWRDGVEGSLEIIYQMFSRFITYVRLWELQRDPDLQQTYKNIDKKILDEWKS